MAWHTLLFGLSLTTFTKKYETGKNILTADLTQGNEINLISKTCVWTLTGLSKVFSHSNENTTNRWIRFLCRITSTISAQMVQVFFFLHTLKTLWDSSLFLEPLQKITLRVGAGIKIKFLPFLHVKSLLWNQSQLVLDIYMEESDVVVTECSFLKWRETSERA